MSFHSLSEPKHHFRPMQSLWLTSLAIAGLFLTPTAAWCSESSELGWSTTGRVSLIGARGNTDSTTAGLELAWTRAWPDSQLKISGGGLLAESTTTDRLAVGTAEDFEIIEFEENTTAAEEFAASIDFSHKHSEKLLWIAGASWEENEAAGFFHRYLLRFGLGFAVRDQDEQCLKMALSLTWTQEDPVVDDDGKDSEFPGLRFTHTYGRPLTQTTRYESQWTLDGNFDDVDDFRSDWVQTFTVSINEWLALQLEGRWRYDNQPALEAVPLLDLDFDSEAIPTVNVELEENDTQLTLALVFHR